MKHKTLYVYYSYLKKLISDYQNNKIELKEIPSYLLKNDFEKPIYAIIPSQKIVYLVNSKVACSSIVKTLTESNQVFYQDIHIEAGKKGVFISELNEVQQSYYKFTFIRNPFERLVSFYINKFEKEKHIEGLGFELENYLGGVIKQDFTLRKLVETICYIPPRLAERHFKPQAYLLDSTNTHFDFIGRFENLDSDFKILQKRFKLQTLPVINKSKPYNYMDYYDLQTLELVNKYYKEDIQRFGYTSVYNEIKSYITSK